MPHGKLTRMDFYRCGVVIGGCNPRSAYDRPAWRPRKIGQIAVLTLIGLLAISVHSQSSNPGGTQSPTAQDCSDPLLASASQCSEQNQNQNPGSFNPNLAPQQRTTPSPANGDYSDIEQLSRQAGARNQAVQPVLPPQPPTDFQNFINSTTGQYLPIYGATLFGAIPSTFAPLDMAPVPPDYVIGPDDELRIRVWGQVSFQANVRVDRSGDIFLPQVGPVHVAGMAFSQLDTHLRSAIGRVYHNFDLTADVGQIRAIQVYVSGQARRPGVYTVSSLSTLVDALFTSGGPSVQGSMRHIQLRRGNELITDFDLYNLLIHGDKSKDVKLQSGDVIFIPPVGSQAAVVGSVRNPAIYELTGKESLLDLIASAGGTSSLAAETRVSIERIEDHRDRHAMEVAYDATGLATPVADGDLVRVYSIVPKYQKTVTLRGNTANPGRFAWHEGMRVSDLIPDKESLITRNYWWKRAQARTACSGRIRRPESAWITGKPVPESEPVSQPEPASQPESVSQPEPVSEPILESVPKSVPKPVPDAEPGPVPEPESVLEPVPEPESVLEPEPIPEPESDSECAAALWRLFTRFRGNLCLNISHHNSLATN